MAEELNPLLEQEYDAAQIQVLEGLEAVRKRPGMYIGSTSSSGLHHLVYEIVDNAIDEALAGFCTEITVTINEGNTITVTDNGRGIPVDIQAQTGRPALEVVYTVLHAGGKFGGGGYKVSGGLHGVGASVVNALSEWLTVQVHRDGNIYEMKFSRGNITQEMKIIGTTDHSGTTVTFKPDGEIFDDLVYDYDILHTRMREQAFLNGGLRITTTDRRPGMEQQDVMHYEGGIRQFATWLNRAKTPLHPEAIYMKGQKGDAIAEVAMQYNDSYNETILSFANNIHTPEGGMHETGFKTALTRVLNAYGVKNNIIKTDADKVSGEDCREGLSCIISVKLTEAQFEGQTKAKLGNAYIRTLVDNIVNDQLATYFEEHPQVAKVILEKAMMANRAREAAKKARESIRRKTALGAGIGDEFDLSKLRYHKIVIMADADVDGAHIRTLLLTFFFRFMRPLIEHGYVYAAVPPLYKLTRGKQQRVAFSEEERERVAMEMRGDNPNAKVDISRYKGLGEMDPHELWETTMDPEKRTLKRIELDDAVRADEIFTLLMGEKVEPRREYIQENAKKAVNLDF